MPPALAVDHNRGTSGGNPPIRLMIVDDSMVARAVLSRMIESDGGFEIVAVAGSAEDAIESLSTTRVDVVMLDLEMPGAGGLKSIPAILKAARGARVLIVSTLAEEGAEATVTALAMGAADTLPKPGTGRFNGTFSNVLLSKLRALGRRRDQDMALPGAPASRPQAIAPRAMVSGPVRLLALGASTGGIHALGTFFHHFPRRIGAPILVTQHLPEPFMAVFARQLAVASQRETVVAADGLRLLPDRVILAPGDASMTLDMSGGHLIVRLDHARSASGYLPSVDPMLASAGAMLGREALGVVFSGMGRDGLEGARALVAAGGSVLIQDEASCAVWGMPRAVAEAGLPCAILPPGGLAERIAERIGDAS
ncbi:MAG TPA: chemotaxis-specific protein-glutamate methyltransferase CheB [Sphingomicrobium sp.]|nr:chemotaxis-specific protein-glutamate methyltransferase CheB [Sphingomicrobium sp.]